MVRPLLRYASEHLLDQCLTSDSCNKRSVHLEGDILVMQGKKNYGQHIAWFMLSHALAHVMRTAVMTVCMPLCELLTLATLASPPVSPLS